MRMLSDDSTNICDIYGKIKCYHFFKYMKLISVVKFNSVGTLRSGESREMHRAYQE